MQPPNQKSELAEDRIQDLLNRCDRLFRGSECPLPTRFNAVGEVQAREVAVGGESAHQRIE